MLKNKILNSLFTSRAQPTLPKDWPATAPADTTLYVVGDIHGYDDAQKKLYALIDEDRRLQPSLHTEEILLADYIDRGPAGKQVIQNIIERKRLKDGVKRTELLGDHEISFTALIQFDHKKKIHSFVKGFLDFGGIETLASYGVKLKVYPYHPPGQFHKILGTDFYVDQQSLIKAQDDLWLKIPTSHLLFLKSLKPFYESGEHYVFAHAGIDPSLSLSQQKIEVLTGLDDVSRDFVKHEGKLEGNKVIVRGHTINRSPVITHNQIGIDTGIYKQGHGTLTCAVLNGRDVRFLQAKTDLPAYTPRITLSNAQERGLAFL